MISDFQNLQCVFELAALIAFNDRDGEGFEMISRRPLVRFRSSVGRSYVSDAFHMFACIAEIITAQAKKDVAIIDTACNIEIRDGGNTVAKPRPIRPQLEKDAGT